MSKLLFVLAVLLAGTGLVQVLIAPDMGWSRLWGGIMFIPMVIAILYMVVKGAKKEPAIHITE